MTGNFFIISAPSGAGKSTLTAKLLEHDKDVHLSVSYTTRAPRPGEVDGRDYHFVGKAAFMGMLERGEFLESAEVHGNHYGTSEAWIRAERAAGQSQIPRPRVGVREAQAQPQGRAARERVRRQLGAGGEAGGDRGGPQVPQRALPRVGA